MIEGNRFRLVALVLGLTLGLVAAGCSSSPKPTAETKPGGGGSAPKTYPVLEARVSPTQGNHCQGTIIFTAQADGSVEVVADLIGLPPMSQHGIHVHETGDCSAPDGTSAGAHFNPTQKPHGLPPAEARHAGDLGNLKADPAGNAHYRIVVDNISLSATGNGILGRAVIVHAKQDMGTQPAGDSGDRVGCGVIAVPDSMPQN